MPVKMLCHTFLGSGGCGGFPRSGRRPARCADARAPRGCQAGPALLLGPLLLILQLLGLCMSPK